MRPVTVLLPILGVLAILGSTVHAQLTHFAADGAMLGGLSRLGAAAADNAEKLDELLRTNDAGTIASTFYCDCLMPRLRTESEDYDPSAVIGYQCMTQSGSSDLFFNPQNYSVIPAPVGSQGVHLFFGQPPGAGWHSYDFDGGRYADLRLNGEGAVAIQHYGAKFLVDGARTLTARFGADQGGLCALLLPGMASESADRVTMRGDFRLMKRSNDEYVLWKPIAAQFVPQRPAHVPHHTYSSKPTAPLFSVLYVLNASLDTHIGDDVRSLLATAFTVDARHGLSSLPISAARASWSSAADVFVGQLDVMPGVHTAFEARALASGTTFEIHNFNEVLQRYVTKNASLVARIVVNHDSTAEFYGTLDVIVDGAAGTHSFTHPGGVPSRVQGDGVNGTCRVTREGLHTVVYRDASGEAVGPSVYGYLHHVHENLGAANAVYDCYNQFGNLNPIDGHLTGAPTVAPTSSAPITMPPATVGG